MTAAELAGWVPAAVLPAATILALRAAWKAEDKDAVSITSWVLFAAANLGGWVYTEKLWAPQSIIAYLVTTALDVAIVAVAWRGRRRRG